MRDDLSWDDVVSNWKEMKPSITGKPSTPQLLHPTSPHLTITTLSIVLPSKRPKSTHAPKRHWKSIENRRAFFTKFAEEMGFDPLVPENWYPITKKQVKAKKVTNKRSYLKTIFTYCNNKGGTILKIFPSLASALAATFPEVTWKGIHTWSYQ